MSPLKCIRVWPVNLIWIIFVLFLLDHSSLFAQHDPGFVRHVRIIETDELNIFRPAGLAYSPGANVFYVLSGRNSNQPVPANTQIFLLTPTEKRRGAVPIAAEIAEPINMAFDGKNNRLLIFKTPSDQLIEVAIGSDGTPDPSAPIEHNVGDFVLNRPQGITVDAASGHLFVLDVGGSQLVRVEPASDGGFDNAVVSKVALPVGVVNPRGLAFDSMTGNLHLLNTTTQQLFELTTTGQVVRTRDLTEFAPIDPQSMVFAPSGDLTDDPGQMSLYVADSGIDGQLPGQIIEFSLIEPPAGAAPVAGDSNHVATVVQTIDMSQFVPPSPDSAGITYLSSNGTLLVSDSEVNEIPALFTGDNLFEMTLPGVLSDTLTTVPFSDEPTGVTYNPADEHLFFSDDTGTSSIYELNPGPDGIYDTADDIVTSFSTEDFMSNDPEGVAFDSAQGVLFIADGVNNEIYRVDPGSNGIFDGVPPTGDDQVTNFDTATLGILDPEGIAYDTVNAHLYVVGEPSTSLAQITTGGVLVRMIDMTAAGALNPAGLAYAPGSTMPTDMNVYVAARGVDNNSDPNENDGKVYELTFPNITPGNTPPTVDAGLDLTVTLPNAAALDASASDDGLPNPPGVLTPTWSQIDGPGLATFANPNAVDTNVSFTLSGTYTLRLTADDGELSASDELTVSVNGVPQVQVTEVRVSASSDDAEERDTGDIPLTNGDLELVFDQGGNQTVGMRFNGLTIPRGATVAHAFVQFKTDEKGSQATSLTVQGEDVDNAATFTAVPFSISSRPRTTAAESWSPPAWDLVGEAGFNQRTTNVAAVVQEIIDRPGWSSGNSLVIIVTGSGLRTAESFDGDPAGAPLLHLEFLNGPPTVDAGSNVTITLPSNANLDGTVSDDGLPDPPATITTTWSVVSGGVVTFTDESVVDTTASFGSAGTYVLRLTADDSELMASDEMTVTVELGVAQLISPNGTITTTAPTFVWSAVAGATEYILVVYDVNNDQIVLMSNYLAAVAGCSGGTNNCMIQPSGLNLPAGDYTWLVRASDGTHVGPWATHNP